MYELTVESSFASAHCLPAHKGKCKNLHGHSFRVQITVEGSQLDEEQGFLIDFSVMKKHLKVVTDDYDHKMLNEIPPFDKLPPTSEALARVIYGRLKCELPGLSSVTVFESEKAWARYRSDE